MLSKEDLRLTAMTCKDSTLTDSEKLARVEQVCQYSCRGIFKRIDENRELFEFLQQKAPDVLERFIWIEGWLAGQDIFLVDLANALEWSSLFSRHPRAWTGRSNESSYGQSVPQTVLFP